MKRLRVCHFPQIPCKPFIVEVQDIEQSKLLCDVLANYDLFQFDNRIKPDYANMTVVEQWNEEDQEQEAWYDEDTGIDDIHDYYYHLTEW